jgi:DNA-binding transcriptional MerR regulator
VLKIGGFARLAGVTLKTLRFYDGVGIFRPARVAPRTGYRLYRASQLAELQQVRWLRELGCSVAEIRELIAAPAGAADYAQRLGALRRRLMLRLALDEERLRRLDAALGLPRFAGFNDAACHVVERRLGPVAVLTIRERVRSPGGAIERMFEATERQVARHASRAPRSPFLLLHDMEYRRQYLDVEVCVPVMPESLVACGGRLIAGVQRAACARFSGPYDQAPLLYDSLLDWMSMTGTRIAGAIREVYLRYGADQNGYTLSPGVIARREADYRTEMQIPLAGA